MKTNATHFIHSNEKTNHTQLHLVAYLKNAHFSGLAGWEEDVYFNEMIIYTANTYNFRHLLKIFL